jgi:hypothetical protein
VRKSCYKVLPHLSRNRSTTTDTQVKVSGETKNVVWDIELSTRDVFFTVTPGTPS